MSDKTRYPLSWPDGWPRSKARARSQFGKNRQAGPHSMATALDFLQGELSRLGVSKELLSTNVQLKLNGEPYSKPGIVFDPGAACYFELNGKPVSLACDKWDRVEDNVWAIARHIEALRGQDRWGVGSIEQAFRGYAALPAIGESSASDWWKTLGVPVNADVHQVRQAYRLLVKKHHPDAGGDAELFNRVQKAMERFERTINTVENSEAA